MDKIAFWDFDGTIARGDSVFPFYLYALSAGKARWYSVFPVMWYGLLFFLHIAPVMKFKQAAHAFIQGMSYADLETFTQGFWQHKLKKRIYPKAVALLQKQRADGFRVVLVSASCQCYMQFLPKYLPVDEVLATRCETDENGCYTGRLTGKNCHGREKVVRIREWLTKSNLTMRAESTCGFGDSYADLPMLCFTGQANAVNPKKKLLHHLPAGTNVLYLNNSSCKG